jgi:hypothetical protein
MTHHDHLIAELVTAMGIGKVEYDELSFSPSKDMLHMENIGNS